MIGGIIARYAIRYNITIYGLVVMSNHYHILASSPESNLFLFAENINREMAKRTNRLINRRGNLWGRRYDDQIVVEPMDALEGLLYILSNPVKHGLVADPKHWPGLSTYWQTIRGKSQTFSFTNYTELNKAKRSAEFVRASDYEITYELKIAPIPLHEKMNIGDVQVELSNLLRKRTRKLCDERRKAGLGFFGRKAILSQRKRGVFPKKTNRTKRPACYSKCPRAIRDFIQNEKVRKAVYQECSLKFRSGDYTIKFPFGCLLPPLHRVPSHRQFVPI
jgi:REP element-mobilizing transposase RayT